MLLVEVLKGDWVEWFLLEKILKWELLFFNLVFFSVRVDFEDGLGDNWFFICFFLVIGVEMLVCFELMVSDLGFGFFLFLNLDVLMFMFFLLYWVILWWMNLIMFCRGKFV